MFYYWKINEIILSYFYFIKLKDAFLIYKKKTINFFNVYIL